MHRSAVISVLILFLLSYAFKQARIAHVRCKEHHLAIRAGIQVISFVASPLLYTVNVSGSCQALELGSRWLQGETSVLSRQGYLDSRDMDAIRKGPTCYSVIHFTWSKSWIRPHKNHQVFLVLFGVFFGCYLERQRRWGEARCKFCDIAILFRLYMSCLYSANNDVTPGYNVCMLGCLIA